MGTIDAVVPITNSGLPHSTHRLSPCTQIVDYGRLLHLIRGLEPPWETQIAEREREAKTIGIAAATID